MGEELTIHYDAEGVILMIDKCPPHPGQDARPVDDLVVGRVNESTGEIENLEILLFDRRLRRDGTIILPIASAFRVIGSKVNRPAISRTGLTIRYDQPDDILTLEQRPPHCGPYRREICEGVSAGLNSETGQIESLEIRSFKARMEQDGKIALPIEASLRLVEPAQVPE